VHNCQRNLTKLANESCMCASMFRCILLCLDYASIVLTASSFMSVCSIVDLGRAALLLVRVHRQVRVAVLVCDVVFMSVHDTVSVIAVVPRVSGWSHQPATFSARLGRQTSDLPTEMGIRVPWLSGVHRLIHEPAGACSGLVPHAPYCIEVGWYQFAFSHTSCLCVHLQLCLCMCAVLCLSVSFSVSLTRVCVCVCVCVSLSPLSHTYTYTPLSLSLSNCLSLPRSLCPIFLLFHC
jgi:hypothetical protein